LVAHNSEISEPGNHRQPVNRFRAHTSTRLVLSVSHWSCGDGLARAADPHVLPVNLVPTTRNGGGNEQRTFQEPAANDALFGKRRTPTWTKHIKKEVAHPNVLIDEPSPPGKKRDGKSADTQRNLG
jgi:hypothetical protein